MRGFPVHGIWQEATRANASHCKKNLQTFFFLNYTHLKNNPPTNKVRKLLSPQHQPCEITAFNMQIFKEISSFSPFHSMPYHFRSSSSHSENWVYFI